MLLLCLGLFRTFGAKCLTINYTNELPQSKEDYKELTTTVAGPPRSGGDCSRREGLSLPSADVRRKRGRGGRGRGERRRRGATSEPPQVDKRASAPKLAPPARRSAVQGRSCEREHARTTTYADGVRRAASHRAAGAALHGARGRAAAAHVEGDGGRGHLPPRRDARLRGHQVCGRARERPV